MKKIISLMAVLALLFTGCTLPWQKDSTTPTIPGQTTSPTDQTKTNPPTTQPDQLLSFTEKPIQVDFAKVLTPAKVSIMGKLTWDQTGESVPKMYEFGTFLSGNYKGQKIYLLQIPCDGPCMTTPSHRLTINPDGTLTTFTKYSDEWWDEQVVLFDKSDNMAISQLSFPEVITDKGTNTDFNRAEVMPYNWWEDLLKYKLFTADQVGDVYIDQDTNCAIVRYPDGTCQRYEMAVNFSKGGTMVPDENYIGSTFGELFDVTWSDGTKTTSNDFYDYKDHYDFSACAHVKNIEYPMSDLKEIGKTSKGDVVYDFKDPEYYALKDMYKYMPTPYSPDGNTQPTITYEQFLAKNPVFFWKDAYGRLLEFDRSEFMTGAEMGKPVIYLYPEKEIFANVQVKPADGISVSDPAYGENGWNVLASPNGSLLNFDDSKIYPYLFWEGYNFSYQMPKEGFVVAENDVKKFFEEKLGVLGLNEKEIGDFLEFWQPKFSIAPYYYITFMPQADFEKLAPLTVTPVPFTVIRVYMDYVPLLEKIEVVEPVLGAPERKGFTVVEWGGALHK